MFQPGNYSMLDRAGTFVYKGVQFAAVGFVAGLGGTALSNLLLSIRKKMDPKFEIQNEAPPMVLNALTWAGHMGLSSNLRYQTLNGLEFALAGTHTSLTNLLMLISLTGPDLLRLRFLSCQNSLVQVNPFSS